MEAVAAEAGRLEMRGDARDLWKIGDGIVWLLYSAVVLWTLQYHEKWADEAQAWLIARDLDLKTIWLHELRYEGSPGLWHTILWVAQHVFHLGYGALGYIGAGFAIAGAAVLIFCAPFPRYIRWPLAFTYVLVYQYAVIARSYTLLPLLAFLAAMWFGDVRRPVRMTIILSFLALLAVHGVIFAITLGFAFALEAWKTWGSLEEPVKKNYYLCAGFLAVLFLFLVIILKPTPDVEVVAVNKAIAEMPEADRPLVPSMAAKLQSVVSGAFLDWTVPSAAFVFLAGAWCVYRRKWIGFTLPVGTLIMLYGYIHGAAHHHGTVFVAAISGLWIAWPSVQERRGLEPARRAAYIGAQLLLAALCVVNIWDAAVVIQNEYKYPYSGAKDAANYLRSVGADRMKMFGFLHGLTAVQAYFDHNLFLNNPTTYFHHGLPLTTTTLNLTKLYEAQPEYIVAYSNDPDLMAKYGLPAMESRGYALVHFSDGYYLYKRGFYEREVYFILKKTGPVPPPDVGPVIGLPAQ